MARMEKNTLIQIFWGVALYTVLLSLILMLRYRLIKIQKFGPKDRTSPKCLKDRPLATYFWTSRDSSTTLT